MLKAWTWYKKKKQPESPFEGELLLAHINHLSDEIGRLQDENQRIRKDMAELEYRYCTILAVLCDKGIKIITGE